MSRIALGLICACALLFSTASPACADHHDTGTETEITAPETTDEESHSEETHGVGSSRVHGKPYPHHWISIFGGGATETGRESHSSDDHGESAGEETLNAGAIGFEYYFAYSAKAGVGVLVEHLGSRIDRNYTVFLPLGYHPNHRWRLVVAPGMEFTEHDDEWALRLGVNYIIPLGGRWEASPEFDVDFIEGGKITYVYGVMLSFML